jgi:hypothetical protein
MFSPSTILSFLIFLFQVSLYLPCSIHRDPRPFVSGAARADDKY